MMSMTLYKILILFLQLEILQPCYCVRSPLPSPPVSVGITAGGNPTAGEQFILTCTATLVEGVSGNLSYKWAGPGVGESGVRGEDTQTLIFNPLQVSYRGEYTCMASLTEDPDSTTSVMHIVVVASK